MATGSVSPKTGKIVNIPDQTVTIGTATDGGTGTTVSVPFTAGSVATGGPVNFYTATSTPGSFTATASTSPITVSGLTSGTSYTFKVKAGNPTGYSSAGESSASNSVTPEQPGVFESIATLNPTGASAIFSSIPSTYKSLQVRISFFQSGNTQLGIQCNTDTSPSNAAYNYHTMFANVGMGGTGSAGSINTDQAYMSYNSVSNNSSYPSVAIIDIHDYASTSKHKTIRSILGLNTNGAATNDGIDIQSGLWRNTAALSTLKLFLPGTNFATGTKVALYGVK